MNLRQTEEEIIRYYQWLEQCYDEALVYYLKSLEGQEINDNPDLLETEQDQYKWWKP